MLVPGSIIIIALLQDGLLPVVNGVIILTCYNPHKWSYGPLLVTGSFQISPKRGEMLVSGSVIVIVLFSPRNIKRRCVVLAA